MWDKVRRYALYGDISPEAFEGVRPKVEANNRVMALVFGSVAALLIAVMLGLSAVESGFSSSAPIYKVGIVCSLVILVVAYLAKRYPILSYVAVYMAIAVFLGYGIAIGTLSRPEEQTVTFMVMLIFVPLIFVDRPIRMAGSLVVAIVVFIALALNTKSGSTLSVDVTDALIFGMLSIVSETVVNRAKLRGYALEDELHEMSETDQLTHLFNRNCYERRITEAESSYEGDICCIYIDVNGLHELNNTQGHAAGDAMLVFVADAVRAQFGPEHSYRIGGDEFVTFTYDLPEDEIHRRIDALTAAVEAEGYHAAIGHAHAYSGTANVSEVIAEAEAEMYANKTAYYQLHDRRARRS